MKDQQFPGLTVGLKLASVDDVRATVTLTAPLSFWKEASQNLSGDAYGAWQVNAAIREVIRQAEQHFSHRVESDPPTIKAT